MAAFSVVRGFVMQGVSPWRSRTVEITEACKKDVPGGSAGRRLMFNLVGGGLLQILAACKDGRTAGIPEIRTYGFDVMLFNFLDRPILDIHLNGLDIGVASSYGMSGVVGGVAVPMGKQSLS